jgi:hypothetical protein
MLEVEVQQVILLELELREEVVEEEQEQLEL